MREIIICLYILLTVSISSGCSHLNSATSERQVMYQMIGEMIVDYDHTSSHQDGVDAFGSGPISTTYEKYYYDHVAKLPVEDRMAYLLAGFFHFDFTGGGTNVLFLELVCADQAAGNFLQILENYLAVSEQLERGYITRARNTVFRLQSMAEDGRCTISIR